MKNQTNAVQIKICGLSRMADIIAANEVMPDYIGFVFAPSRRQVGAEKARKLSAALDPRIKKVGVFVNQPAELMIDYLHAGIIDIVQLHGDEPESVIDRIRRGSGKPVIRAVTVTSAAEIEDWQNTEADYLLLDHGRGGTGKTFVWKLLNEVREMRKPYFLAGGLNQGNIREALSYRPYGVDLSTGAESDGKKDAAKMKALVEAVRRYG